MNVSANFPASLSTSRDSFKKAAWYCHGERHLRRPCLTAQVELSYPEKCVPATSDPNLTPLSPEALHLAARHLSFDLVCLFLIRSTRFFPKKGRCMWGLVYTPCKVCIGVLFLHLISDATARGVHRGSIRPLVFHTLLFFQLLLLPSTSISSFLFFSSVSPQQEQLPLHSALVASRLTYLRRTLHRHSSPGRFKQHN